MWEPRRSECGIYLLALRARDVMAGMVKFVEVVADMGAIVAGTTYAFQVVDDGG
jgi:hypothetical protein